MNRLLLIASMIFSCGIGFSQNTGATPCDAVDLYPAAIGDCSNSCGAQLCGEYQCQTSGCTNVAMPGIATVDGSCTPDNDIGQSCTWISVTATATDLTIDNETSYAGPGAANIEKKDYTIFSGPCGSLTEVGCASDIAGGGSANFTGLTVGDTYFIMVTRSQTSITEGCPTCNASSSCAQSTVPYDPANDDCTSSTSMSSGVPITGTNGNSTVGTDLAVCLNPASGSVENTVWFEWCAPGSWVAGDTAYVHVYNQTCNGTQGMQMSVYGATETCATIAAGTATSLVCENPGTTSDYYFTWTANAGECFLIILDGFAGTACTFDIQVNDSPILTSVFDGLSIFRDDQINVEWKVKLEADNSHFNLSFSEDVISFEEIAQVQSIGNHSTGATYSYTDVKSRHSGGYYRLSQVDLNGKETILATTYLAGTFKASAQDMRLYPNPADQSIAIEVSHQGNDIPGKLYIYSMRGELLSVHEKNIRSGQNLFTINTRDFPEGSYYIKLISGEKVWQTKCHIMH